MSSSEAHGRPVGGRRRDLGRAAAYALPVALGTTLWLVALHAIEGSHERSEPPVAVHWLRDAALALPVVFLAAGLGIRLAAGSRPSGGRLTEPLAVAAATSVMLVAALPAHESLFGGVEAEALALPVHLLREWIVAAAVAGCVAVVVHRAMAGPAIGALRRLRPLLPGAAAALLTGYAVTVWLLILHLVGRTTDISAQTIAARLARDGLLTAPLVAAGALGLVWAVRRRTAQRAVASALAIAFAGVTGAAIGFAAPATERVLEVFRHGSHPLVDDASLVVLPGSSGGSLALHVADHALALLPVLAAAALAAAWLAARRRRTPDAGSARPRVVGSAGVADAPGASMLVAHTLTRRELVRAGVATGIALSLPLGAARARADEVRSPRFTPFTRRLTVQDPIEPVGRGAYVPTVAGRPEWGTPRLYEITMREGESEILPGFLTPIYGYDGSYPGPTFRVRGGEPAIVRFHNALRVPTVIHNHGGHQPGKLDGDTVGDSDSFPDDLILPGRFKDYLYPHIAPDGDAINADFTSTQWYHDHAVDITGPNVYAGLVGWYLLTDDLERDLIARRVIPDADHDLPLALQDRRFDSRGRLVYDTDSSNGALGDVYVVNGKAQPFVVVERRKYRLRLLNGANARYFHLRMSNGAPFLQIGTDSWLLPAAVQRTSIDLAMAQRADVIVDFRFAPSEVYLMNLMQQDDARRPGEVKAPGVPILKFVVRDGPAQDNASAAPGTRIRPQTSIREDEIVRTRRFRFDRSGGRWTINGKGFDHNRDDATPRLGTAERWIIENSSGGWAHPVHIHLEAHHTERINGRRPQPWEAFNRDTTLLDRNGTAQIVMRFRTFPGRFVFHCHNVEHEDMRMMGAFNVLR